MKKPTFSKIAAVLFLVFANISAYAQLAVPFNPRLENGSIRVKGDIVFIGNSIVTGAGLPQPYNGNGINNNNEGVYINVENDGDPSIFSSSSANLVTDNSCKEILFAGLYWASVYPLEEANNPSVQFEGTPRFEDWNEIKFRVPGGNYIDLVADNDPDAAGEEDDIIFDGYEYYGAGVENSFKDSPIICYKNVTNLLRDLPEADGEYAVANLRATRGRRRGGCSAGWTLVVIYESPTLPSKYIALFDGYAGVQGNTELDIPVSGFQTLPAPLPVNANIGVGALEGDIGIGGDSFRFKADSNPDFTVISDNINQANNFFNSSITRNGVHNLDRNPTSTNTLGMDINNVNIPNPNNIVIPNGETAGDLKLTTNGDGYGAFVTSFAVEIIEPNIVLTKVVEDENGNNIGGQVVNLGQELEYVIGFQNTGNDDAVNFTIRDVLPVNTILDFPDGLTLPAGVTVQSYDVGSRELVFAIDESLVEEFDPAYEIRIQVTVVESCQQLIDACTDLIQNQAFATYSGETNPTFEITDDPSYSSNTGCLLSPQTTNFLADLDDCLFEQDAVLCTSTLQLTAANGYSSYAWSPNPSGTPIIGTTQTITVDATGTYYSFNTADAPCQSIVQQYNVELFGGTTTNPVIPYADEVVICPNDGKELPNIYLCGADDFVNIDTDVSGASSIIWEQLDESSCPAVSNTDCANEDDACNWNQVSTGQDFLADSAGQFRLTINYEGGCFVQFYFNVYQNLLAPTVTTEDIVCTTPGSITVSDVPSGYEYSLDGVNYQSSNIFTVNTAGFYTVYIRQIGVDSNPCVFTVPDIQIRERDFSVDTTVTQAACNGGLGNIQISVNDVEPQYTFEIFNGGTLVNSVGPTIDNTYTFENLNPGNYTINTSTEDGCVYSENITITEPPLLTVTAALTIPLTCSDGEITIYPQGGTAPYFYFINSSTDFQTVPEYTVTSAGVYNITVVDANNCSAETTINVEAAGTPNFNIATTNIICSGDDNGSIAINVNDAGGNTVLYSNDGGTTFTNSNVFSGLTPGDYDVVVQYSFGGAVCASDVQTVTITENDPINGTAELLATFTCTSTATLEVTNVFGGTAPYMFSIDGFNFQNGTSFNNLSPGNYTVTIRDANNCTFITNAVDIAPLNPPTDLEFSHSPINCSFNTTTINVTNTVGGTGNLEYQIIAPASATTPYQTATDFSGLEPRTYVFQVRDENDCTYSESYTVDPLPTTTINVVLTESLDCTASPDAVISGTINGTAPFTYGVSFNGGTFTDLGNTPNTFTYSTSNSGNYQFEITDGNGCSIQSSIITINPITPPSISSLVQSQDINCHGENTGALDITIDNTVGTPPFVMNISSTSGIDYGTQTTGLPADDYVVTITDANSCTDAQNISISQPDAIIVNHSAVDITCTSTGVSQGSVIINSVSGGTAPYNYFVTGTNGYSNSELNNTGSTSVSFNVVDFGLYEINVIDANGCSVLVQDVLVASPPSDLDINITSTVDCSTGGTSQIAVSSALSSSGPFFFAIYDNPNISYPSVGTWIPESPANSGATEFTGLTPGVTYTFIVHDTATNCSYYEVSTLPIPTNSTLIVSAPDVNNISCTGSADGNVSFTITSTYSTDIDVSYQVLDSQSLSPLGTAINATVGANSTLVVSDFGPLPFGNYFVNISETSGPNAGCGVVTTAFNITESEFPLALDVSVNQNANCNPNSGVISAVASNGTAPYLYQITTTATSPLASDTNWGSANTFNLDADTYYVHVLDAYGCVLTSPATILPMDDAPEISSTINDDCLSVDGTFQIDVDLIVTGTAPYSISIDGGAFQVQSFPFSISNLATGNHTVEINDVNGCGNLVSVDILPILDVTAVVTAQPTCNNNDGEISLNPSGGSGVFTYSITPISPSITITGNTISGVPFGNYEVEITDTNTGCIDNVSVSLVEPIAPSFILTPNTLTCFGDNSGSFYLEILNYSGTYTYEVTDETNTSIFGAVSSNTTTNPLTINGLTSGTFTVTVTETEVPFCASNLDVIINSPSEALQLDVTETSNVTCNNNQGTITAIASGGWGNYEYELTGDATVGYSPNGTFADLSAGNYTVNVRDAEGCIVSENIILEEPNPIVALFTPSATTLSCFGDADASITITNVVGGQGSNYSFTLNTIAPVVTSSGPQTSNVFNNLSAGTYSVTITDGFDCEMTSAPIEIDNPTQINASLVKTDNQTCLTEASLTLSATGGTAPYTYSSDANFTSVLGTFNNSTTFDVSAGTYSFYVRDDNGCIASVSNTITVEPIPELSITLQSTNPTINCAGDNTGSITAVASGGLQNYVYTLQDTAGNTVAATQNTPGYFTELIAGNYVVVVESGDCEAISNTIPITEPSTMLEATVNVTNVQCTGTDNGSITIDASGGTGVIKYAISPQLNQFFDTNVFENLAPGDYDIIVQDELGCYLTFTETVTEPVQVLLGLVPNSILPEVCDGEANGEFSIEISGGTTPYSVSLGSYEGPYITGQVGQTVFDFTDLSGGDQSIFVRDSEGCESEWNIPFPTSIRINPTVEVSYDCDQNAQVNTVTVIVDESITDMSTLDFSLNGGPYQESNIFTNIDPSVENYIDVRHSDGCIQRTELFDMSDYEPVTLDVTDGEEINQIIANASGGTGEYTYTFNDEDYGEENTYTISSSGIFTITATDSNGCSAVVQIVREFIEICIPNYFTPNGDGVTDTWTPGCAENYPNLEFDIFDRYGRKVATYRAGEYWDGRYNGTELPTGDYWYVVRPNDDTVSRSFVGHFTLYR
ncbi:T9SS type B sorting domain-containing protein [Winogradskyella litorisediminis]|uniref:T9SS type B sorting domain-containing protein n=1 Tax=Winogradskyella litorisediminis TaxID=1156618 RepID=A0ABW3N2B7_9FLAO